MCKFVKSIFIVATGALLIAFISTFIGLWKDRSSIDFRIQPEQHIVVIGNSLGECSINDSILPGWRNLCRGGEYYVYSIPVLENVLAVNPQIDTVFIVAGIPSFAWFGDTLFYNEHIQALRSHSDRIAISDKSEWKLYFSNRSSKFVAYLLTSGLYNIVKPASLGNYMYTERHFLQGDKGGMAEYEQTVKKRGGRHYSYEMLRKSQVQIYGFEKMIDICKKHHVTCVILNTPLYHIERYYEDKGYIDYLSTLDDSLLVADYNSFEFPDTLYYGDVHHLNHLGAEYFCKYLKKNGIKIQYLVDYVNRN